MPRKVDLVRASIGSPSAGLVEITLHNMSGHSVVFNITGIDPPLFVGLDGNTSHSMDVTAKEYIEIREKDSFGRKLAAKTFKS